ncbi:MAG: SdrD B-like domain-containing protein [Elainellaceae cyanobacterium]
MVMRDSALANRPTSKEEAIAPSIQLDGSQLQVQPLIIAGDPNGSPPDFPADRVDPNTANSPFAGVGSLSITPSPTQSFLCSGAAISPRHILTAAHCLDVEGEDGIIDVQTEDVTVNLNVGSDLSTRISASALNLFPEYAGFSNGLNNDLAIVTLSDDLPANVPIYSLFREPLPPDTILTMVGYGTTGNGLVGFVEGTASAAIKRIGQNQIEDTTLLTQFIPDIRENFLFDFDGPDASTNSLAVLGSELSLGNTVEATVGPGDSGGPSFIQVGDALLLAGVNTFAFAFPDAFAPPEEAVIQGTFGSGGGGVILSAPEKLAWIDSIIGTVPPDALGQISGSIWNDLNRNGERDTTEPGLANWRVYVDDNQNGVLDAGESSTTTDVQGNYGFQDLVPGTYTVAQGMYPGWTQTFPTTNSVVLLNADFSDEVGNPSLDGFTIDNTNDSVEGLWHLSTGRGTQVGHSADDSLYFGTGEGITGGGTYNVTPNPGDRTAGKITSPVIDLAALSTAELSFNYFLNVEPSSESDRPRVLISQDGGAFQPIADKGNGLSVSAANATAWRSATVDVTAYIGSTIQIQFDFDTVDHLLNSLEGWYIDDVVVQGVGSTAYTVAIAPGQTRTGIDFGNQLINPSPPANPLDGDNVLIGTNGADTLRGENGDDILRGKGGADRLYGNLGSDVLEGNGGRDMLYGGIGADTLRGGIGADELHGNGGADTLMGNGGDDVLIGGIGRDKLTGGRGSDRIVYRRMGDRRDTITDFNPNQDVIDISQIFDRPAYSSSNPFADYVRLVQRGSRTHVQLDANGGMPNAFQTVVMLENVDATSLSASQFIL